MGTIHSYNTFLRVVNDPEQMTKRKELLEVFKVKDRTLYEVEALLPHFRPGTLSARWSELLDFGMIKEVREGIYSYVEDETEQKELLLKRQKQKRDKWEKLGYEEGWFDLWKFENGYMKDGK